MAKVNDLTDAFDVRLAAMQRNRAPKNEENAAIVVYERMRTARAICKALLEDGYTEAAVVAVLGEISAEARSPAATKLRE